jgi:Zn-dependent protease with chaperone function
MPSISAMSSDPMIPGVYSDGESAALHTIVVKLASTGLTLSGEDIAVEWPIKRLRRLPSPADGSIMLALHGSDARLIISPEHADVLRQFFPVLMDARKVRRGTIILGASLTALAASVAGFLFFGLPALSGPLAHMTPLAVEERMGEQSNHFVSLFSNECVASPAAQASLDELGERLRTVSQSPFELKLRIIDAQFPNAFALPGGWIVVTDDLIDLMESPDELAGVLAHETAHVSQRHVMSAQIREMGFGMLLEFMIGGGSGAGQGLARAGASLESYRHTRGAEAEADDFAMQYLVDADLNPDSLAQFFDRLAEFIESESRSEDNDAESVDEAEPVSDSGASGEWVEALLRTHPETRERAEKARLIAASIDWSGEPALSDDAWAEIQSVCSEEDSRSDQELDNIVETIKDVLDFGDENNAGQTSDESASETPD